MKELGMTSAFDYENAEFPNFCDRLVYISNMFQKAIIDLDEEGTEAAAVTVIGVEDAIPTYYTFHANRPFFYIISEQSTGTIFFMGQYKGFGQTNAILPPSVQEESNSDAAIYDLSGRRINSQFSTFNSQLKKGVYIQNGKKISK